MRGFDEVRWSGSDVRPRSPNRSTTAAVVTRACSYEE